MNFLDYFSEGSFGIIKLAFRIHWKPYEKSKKYSLSSAADFSAFWRRERVVVLCIRKTCLRLLSATPDNSVPSVGTQRQFQYRGTAQDFDGKFILILLCFAVIYLDIILPLNLCISYDRKVA